MRPVKKIFHIISLLIFCFLISCGGDTSGSEYEEADFFTLPDPPKPEANSLSPVSPGVVRSIKVRNIGPLAEVFNDSNHIQMAEAQRLGIDPISDIPSAYFLKRPIVKVESCGDYYVDSLTHSLPYLVPEAAQLLGDIGRNFKDSLKNRGGDSYLIKVTSMLRTPYSVSKLRRVNVNATDSSTHQYATTFDISYSNFYCLNNSRQINQGDLKNLLGEVLLDLRKQGRCLVKFEKQTSCFHITAIK